MRGPDRFDAVRARVRETLSKAHSLYGVVLQPEIDFDLSGRVAGQASVRLVNGLLTNQRLRFNRDIIMSDDYEGLLSGTVPHEVAHLVCFARPELGNNHNPGWKRVCRSLGGTGSRCHNYEVQYAAGTYRYVASCGTVVSLSKILHRRIQQGQERRLRSTGGILNNSCRWTMA